MIFRRHHRIILAFVFIVLLTSVASAANRPARRANKGGSSSFNYVKGTRYTFYGKDVIGNYPFNVIEFLPALKMYKSKVGFRHKSGKVLYVSAIHRTSQDANWFMRHLRQQFKVNGDIKNLSALVKDVDPRFIKTELKHFTEAY